MESATTAGSELGRRAGFLPIGAYAAIGDGHTVALVGTDGCIDWLPLPNFSDPSVFAAILDPERGGRFSLAPAIGYDARRRYLPGTNILETTFETAEGTVRVTDGMNIAAIGLLPGTELVRRIEGLSGAVPMRWALEPRFDYGAADGDVELEGDVAFVTHGETCLALQSFEAGTIEAGGSGVHGGTTIRGGDSALLAMIVAADSPLLLPHRGGLEERFDQTAGLWRSWLGDCPYDGPWADTVRRSLLALKLLVYEPAGAIVAAPTTSLPERIGGSRNYDYRYSWVRDTTFALDAALRLGVREQAHRSFTWLLDATRHTHPRLQPIYRLDGHPPGEQDELDLVGYRQSQPVHAGNAASGQPQLGNYADLLETAYLYVSGGARLDPHSARRLAQAADIVCDVWRNADCGIWELHERRQYTQSKMGCWTALDRALKLADGGALPDEHADRWRQAADEVKRFVLDRCWSDEKHSFVRAEGREDLDAATLLAARMEFVDPAGAQMTGTIDAIRRELTAGGPLLYRYTGMQDEEGAFVACSFWLAEALSRARRTDEAAEVIEAMTGFTNDLGLLSEEIDPSSGELLGNFPQGLSHLSLLNAVAMYEEATR